MAKNKSLSRLKKSLQIEPDKLDKFLDYYHSGKPLADTDMVMLERYRKAWSWYSLGRPFDSILAMLMKEYGLQERQCRYIIAEAVAIHGNINQVDRDGKKVASANFFRMVANMALMNGEWDAATRAWDKADHMDGLHEEETGGGWDPDAFSKPGKFVFINNVNVLQQHLKNQMEDDE
ncbi:hypothetical protein [Spirosoma endophyticum]|uniref:Uncharacterized protein n=1 Tax=Spirosoma endophyticum TaxID=662367 RepID=A0A1I1SKX2_9BACT|nr:hypothetical protein [Spirosoma endophyticum]SFD47125.1 hypothetical protein SAMN05216167_105145 [Spirosoma endophyticum]